MGFGVAENFYGDQGLSDFENLSNLQSNQALGYGDQAAAYADPFMKERGQYQNQLSKLMQNPGSFASSPAYKFAYNQGMNALQRKGSVRSGNKLAELMKYGQGMASQLYGQQAQLLSNLAMSGSSPAAAGLAYSRGTERSQDYRQMGAAAKNAGSGSGIPGAKPVPLWAQSGPLLPPRSDPYRDAHYSGGGASYGGGGGSYSPGGTFGNVGGMSMAQLNAEASLYGMPTMNPYGGGSGGAFSGGSGYGGFANNYTPQGGGGGGGQSSGGGFSGGGQGYGGGQSFVDPWDAMGDPSAYGMGGGDFVPGDYQSDTWTGGA